jgi:hypothetical protein
MAGTLAETYLGRDAGRRVMSGRIARGVADKISAVLWYGDLHGFTQVTDSARQSRSSRSSTTMPMSLFPPCTVMAAM